MKTPSADVLFLPLNTNHVGIFHSVVPELDRSWIVLCHDRISENEVYRTEERIAGMGLPFIHMPERLDLKSGIPPARIMKFLRLKSLARTVLDAVRPRCVVLAMDNDPIAKAFVDVSREKGVKSLMIQEGLVRQHEYTGRPTLRSDFLHRILNQQGIYLKYIRYGAGNCDRYLVSGPRARQIFMKRGVPADRIEMVGQPKYDAVLRDIKKHSNLPREAGVLFAAPTDVLRNPAVLEFTRRLAAATEGANLPLTIKLHPRSVAEVGSLLAALGEGCRAVVVKEGDDTFTLLKKHTVLAAISSTVVLEGLLLGKECIVADYLAGESRLDYSSYQAVHSIPREEDVEKAVLESLCNPTPTSNKQKLLMDELFQLDGMAGRRAAERINAACA